MNGQLSTIAGRLKTALTDAACGPLMVAGEVVKLAAEWDTHKEEAGDISPTAWLEKTFGAGKDLAWFQRRADAVEKIGEASKRTWHHEAAVWAASQIRDPKHLTALATKVMEQRKRNGSNPLTLQQVKLLATGIAGRTAQARGCRKCEELKKRIAELEEMLRHGGAEAAE